MKNILTIEELLQYANMSALDLNSAEQAQFVKDLQSFISYTQELNHLCLDEELEGTRSVNVLREDKAKAGDAQNILDNCKNTHARYFVVPKILKED